MYMAELGYATAWAGVLGSDPLGVRIVETLEKHGVDTTFVTYSKTAPTGVYFKNPGAASPKVHYYRKGSAASYMHAGLLDSLPLESVRLVHASGVTAGLSSTCRVLMESLASRLRDSPASFSFDVNYRPGIWGVEEAAPVLLSLARAADYVFVGRDEAQILWNTTTAQSVLEHIRPRGTLIVKDGSVGAVEFSSAGEVFVPSPRIEVVEEVGAGDAFAAGYLAARMSGGTAEKALTNGHMLAARTLRSTSDFVPCVKPQ